MLCPYCGHENSIVLESRDAEEGRATRRRRECEKCGKRYTTYERVGNIELKVIKKDGREEDFSREKLEKGVRKACWKRPVREEDIVAVVDEIEMKLLNRKNTRIPSKDIGGLVMRRVKKLDPIAYVRFASVYLDVESVDEIAMIVSEVQNKN